MIVFYQVERMENAGLMVIRELLGDVGSSQSMARPDSRCGAMAMNRSVRVLVVPVLQKNYTLADRFWTLNCGNFRELNSQLCYMDICSN